MEISNSYMYISKLLIYYVLKSDYFSVKAKMLCENLELTVQLKLNDRNSADNDIYVKFFLLPHVTSLKQMLVIITGVLFNLVHWLFF